MKYIPRSSNSKNGSSSTIPRMVKKKRTFRVFGFLGTVMMLVSATGTAGVFFFKNISEGQLEEAKVSLTEASNLVGDSKAKINEIRLYDQQLVVANRLLDNHLAPSILFDALELNTKETVQYKRFEYIYDPGFDALLTLGGGTEEFTSVVLQKTQLDSIDSPFEVVIVNDVTKDQVQEVDEDGNNVDPLYEEDEVSFNVTGLLKTTRFGYTGENVPVVVDDQPVSDLGQDISNENNFDEDNQ